MAWFVFAFVCVLVLLVIQGYRDSDQASKRKVLLNNSLNSISDFKASQIFEGPKALFLFAVDKERSKIALIRTNGKAIAAFSDIIAVEISEDGETIFQKSTSRTIGGALIGGVLAGGVGAIVGGLSGGGKHSEKASTVIVKILLRNIDAPTLEIVCFDSKTMTASKASTYPKAGKIESYLYTDGRKKAESIKDVVSVIIDKIDSDSKIRITDTSNSLPASGSVSDELVKLFDLKEKGILSEAEFLVQKQKLLSS